ncbi:MAG: RAQPRD family integrative conjugative element protein [Bryobacteraceae bacterium]|nr:RAQPRD family integrative conjugative element protein [Bryobacteraceae bacterium]
MSRKSLGVLAVIIIVLMGIVAFAGLDHLPRKLRASVETAAQQLPRQRGELEEQRAAIDRALREEPDLFRAQAAEWREKMERSQSLLAEAAKELTALQALAQANQRSDAEKVQQALSRYNSALSSARENLQPIRAEAERWIEYKRNLPRHLEAMKGDYASVSAFDVDAAVAGARKAQADWPSKKDDIETRIAAVRAAKADAEAAWQSSAAQRAKAEANDLAGLDYAALFAAGDKLAAAVKELKPSADAVNALAAQLYVNWDKLLLDVDEGDNRQQVRYVRTRFPDASLQNGAVSQEEKWEPRTVRDERALGMVVERKPAGKYDSESEKSLQPPAYAYVAPPGQSNQYGSWQNGVWTWLPQYLLLSQMLRGPITGSDYGDWARARSRGETYYGRDGQGWYRHSDRGRGSGNIRRTIDWMRREGLNRGAGDTSARRREGSGWWSERPRGSSRPSWSSGSDGFGSSRYRSRGTFGGSRYSSPSSGFGSRSYSRGFGGGFRRGGRR